MAMAFLKSTALYSRKNADSRRSTERRSLMGGKIIRIGLIRCHGSVSFFTIQSRQLIETDLVPRQFFLNSVSCDSYKTFALRGRHLSGNASDFLDACDGDKSIVDWLL